MADEHEDDTTPETVADDTVPGAPEKEHHVKDDVRKRVAKAFGLAVEAGSILAGDVGDVVGAERTVAEADAESAIDRIDGED